MIPLTFLICLGLNKEKEWHCKNGSCFSFKKIYLNFFQANIYCKRRNSMLLSINSAGVNKFIDNLTAANEIWLGLKQDDSKISWLTQKRLEYSNWLISDKKNKSFKCFKMIYGGEWVATNCFELLYFVCEKG